MAIDAIVSKDSVFGVHTENGALPLAPMFTSVFENLRFHIERVANDKLGLCMSSVSKLLTSFETGPSG